MTATYDHVREAVLNLPKEDQARILAVLAMEVTDAHPGIDFQANVCGGSARIIRTRIPVWLLESLRRQGKTDAELLAAYPSLNAEDLANAWNYARSHRDAMDREIAANGASHVGSPLHDVCVKHSLQPTQTNPLFHYGGHGLLHALHDEEFVVTSSVDFDDPFEFLPRVLQDDGNGRLGSQVGDVETVQEAGVGIFYALCLSRKLNDIRMWAQYGDNHKGLMLTVDFTASQKTQEWLNSKWVLDVDYPKHNHRHEVHWGGDNRVKLPPDEIKSLFTIKGYDWRDQLETRVVVPNGYLIRSPENGCFKFLSEQLRAFIKVPQACITKVTLGYRSSPGLLASVKKLKEVKRANWIISKVDRHPSKFEFEENIVNQDVYNP